MQISEFYCDTKNSVNVLIRIEIGNPTHIRSIGLIQLCQAFFLCRKGDFSLSAIFQNQYCESKTESLLVYFFIAIQHFNDYLTIYTITLKFFKRRVEFSLGGNWRI